MLGGYFFKFKNLVKRSLVSHIIWDFDGTMYQSEELANQFENKYVNLLKKYNKFVSLAHFKSLLKKTGSWSAAVALYKIGLSEYEIIEEVEKNFDTSVFIPKNQYIVSLIYSLRNYRHIIISNSTTGQIIKGLQKIGFENISNKKYWPFELIIGRNTTRRLKPDIEIFKRVQRYTRQQKFRHLVIGDSEHHDIIPARKFGFQAIFPHQVNHFFNPKL